MRGTIPPPGATRYAGARAADSAPRAASGADVLYGRQPVIECLRAARRRFHSLYIATGVRPGPDMDRLLSEARLRELTPRPAESPFLDQLTGGGNHQGVVLETGPYPYAEPADDWLAPVAGEPAPLVLILDHVQDPQNLGAMLRTAEGAGVRGVFLPADRACGVTPAVVRASAGASEHIRVARVTNLVRSMEWVKKHDGWIAGLESDPAAKLCWEQDLSGPLAVVIGSEGAGLGRLVREACDYLVRLPMGGRVESYNAGVAAAMVLYEVRRQQTTARKP